MALIRGALCDFPCPICLAAKEKLFDGKVYAIRTTQSMKKVYEDAQQLRTAKAKEVLFKSHGLRDIKVCILIAWLSTNSCYDIGPIECLLGT
jgi:hypothetical protein